MKRTISFLAASLFVLLLLPSALGDVPVVFRKESGSAPYEDVTFVDESPFDGDAKLLRVDILGIRQGDCILITCGDERMLVDGGETIRFDFVYEQYFKSHGIDSLDYMFLTHAHDDHLELQQRLLKRGFPVGDFYSPYDDNDTNKLWNGLLQVLRDFGIPFHKVENEDTLHVGDAELTVWQYIADGTSLNDQSACLMVRYGDASLFLTADIGGQTEKWLCENYPDALDADIMKSPHHGIVTNVTEFLEKVSPSLVVITNTSTNSEKYSAQLDRMDIPRCYIMKTVHLETDGTMWYVWTDRE